MSEVSVTWVEKGQFVGVDSSKHGVVISMQDEENMTGSKPSDLLLLALGSCGGVDLVSILRKQRQAVSGVRMVISGEQQSDPPWTFTAFNVEITIRGKNVSAAAVARAVDLSFSKYCSVAATLSAAAPIKTSYRLIEE